MKKTTKRNEKVELGTRWGWEVIDRPVDGARIWAVTCGLRRGVGAIAVRPHPHEGGFTVDLLPSLGPWECYVDGPFATPELAAAAAVEKYENEPSYDYERGLGY